MQTPPPDNDNELTPQFKAATEQAADVDSPTDEFSDIPMAIDVPEPKFNSATEDAAADELDKLDE